MHVLRWKGWLAAALALTLATAGCSSASEGSTAGGASESASMAADTASPSAFANSAAEMPAGEAPMEKLAATEQESPAATGGSGFGTSTAAPTNATATNRMLIYKANLTMEVESYADAYTEIQNLIHLSGGYIVQFSEQSSTGEKSGLFSLKVPAGDFNGFLERLEDIPKVSLNRSMSAQDVSEEYVDLESRLKAKEVVEARYLEYMGGAAKSEDLIRYTNELAAIQEEIERLKGRMRYLQQNVAYSTVELRVYEKLEPSIMSKADVPGLGDRMGAALSSSLNVMAIMAQGIMVMLAAAIPVILVVTLFGLPIYWWIRRRKAKSEEKRPLIP
ncbi:DUF4349 domain-containing protein [Paenibacillus sp. TRM 82003]|nr:DUF4349 domain-containing protein [Paenibacillus sp. TRM 82003]